MYFEVILASNFKHLTPKSDKCLISPSIITTVSNIKFMRIKKIITNSKRHLTIRQILLFSAIGNLWEIL